MLEYVDVEKERKLNSPSTLMFYIPVKLSIWPFAENMKEMCKVHMQSHCIAH